MRGRLCFDILAGNIRFTSALTLIGTSTSASSDGPTRLSGLVAVTMGVLVSAAMAGFLRRW